MVTDPLLLGETYLLDVIGRPARHGEFLFLPVLLDGPIGKRECRLGERLDRPAPDDLTGEFEALWVRARIGRVFGIAPPSPLGKRCLLDAAFLAVRHPRRGPFLEAYPLVCTDSDGDEPEDYEWFDTTVGLAFPRTAPPKPETRGRIAEAFWGLLLAAPDDLATFGDYHESYDDHRRVGCDGRRLFCDEILSGHGEASMAPAYGFGLGGRWACPDCDGEGIEFFADLFEQTCETCRGMGVVAWVEDDTK